MPCDLIALGVGATGAIWGALYLRERRYTRQLRDRLNSLLEDV